MFACAHVYPSGVSLYAVSEQLPGVNEHVTADCALTIPARKRAEHARVRDAVARRQLVHLVRLRVQPTQRLQAVKQRVLRQLRWAA